MQDKIFKVYVDSGHGWIAVKRKDLYELGVLNKITRYSYQRGDTVYIEEDCDATTFIKAFKDKFGCEPHLAPSKYSHCSPIRSYDYFRIDQ